MWVWKMATDLGALERARHRPRVKHATRLGWAEALSRRREKRIHRMIQITKSAGNSFFNTSTMWQI